MRNKSGFAHILLLVVGVFVLVIIVMVAMGMRGGSPAEISEAVDEERVFDPEPVSEDTDINTIEQELNATVTGDFETDANSMEKDASEL